MLGKDPPTTSSLNLMTSDIAVEPSDITDGLGISRKMSDVVESLDTRELDMGDGEETDNDPTTIGVCV